MGLSVRIAYMYAFFAVLCLALFSFFIYAMHGALPCPLCLANSLVLLLVAISLVPLSCCYLRPWQQYGYAAVLIIILLFGLVLGLRELWIDWFSTGFHQCFSHLADLSAQAAHEGWRSVVWHGAGCPKHELLLWHIPLIRVYIMAYLVLFAFIGIQLRRVHQGWS
jgi:disulfide bond formation protein DsbB